MKMVKRIFVYGLVLIIGATVLSSCRTSSTSIGPMLTSNSKASLKQPYLILVSLDGFRWDYVERFNPPHLSDFIENGVKAESLIPSFPSKTFPNHYTIATGMYPDGHGILGNSFYSHKKNLTYTIGNRKLVEDGSFYNGTPIWVQADRADMVTASYFFVGSEADIQGVRPTYYFRYDGRIKNDIRVDQVLNWLKLPQKKRPHLITMYFSDMDDVGHSFGPDNDKELRKALFDLDEVLGHLFKETEATGLPINIIIVSDHGMTALPTTNLIPIEEIKNDTLFSIVNNGAIVNIHPKNKDKIALAFKFLKQKESNFKVYKTENTPGFEYRPKNKDWGALQVIPDFSYYFLTGDKISARKKSPNKIYGAHGYDPSYKDMHGIFYAKGPAIKNGYTVPSVKNIHVYPLMCEILGLEIPGAVDGELGKLKNVLKND